MTQFPAPELASTPSYRLSPRQLEVLRHFATGLTYDQIARRMGVTRHTVDTYLRRIREKSGASSGAELTRLAVTLEEADDQLPRPPPGPLSPTLGA